MVLLCLLLSAAAETPSETISPPVTLGAFRAAFPAGTLIRMRMQRAGEPAVESRWHWLEVDANGGRMSSQIFAADGTLLKDEGVTYAPWTELMGHAAFPKDKTVVGKGQVDVPAGHFDTALYTVTAPGEDGVIEQSSYHFLPNLPGPPVLYTVTREGKEVFRMEMLERRVDRTDLKVPTDPAADALAAKIAAQTGNPWAEKGLVFDFVIGTTSRHHRWDIKGNRVEVTWDRPQQHCVAVLPVGYAGSDPLLTEAWSLFVNDQYWLLAPAKVQDAGVVRTADGNDLRLFFEGVGLTPGDRYLIHADDQGVVLGWDFVLQSGRSGNWTWAPPTTVGNLHLSLSRSNGEREIRFENVSVGRQKLGKDGATCVATS